VVSVCGACKGRRPVTQQRVLVVGVCQAGVRLSAAMEVGAVPMEKRAGHQRHGLLLSPVGHWSVWVHGAPMPERARARQPAAARRRARSRGWWRWWTRAWRGRGRWPSRPRPPAAASRTCACASCTCCARAARRPARRRAACCRREPCQLGSLWVTSHCPAPRSASTSTWSLCTLVTGVLSRLHGACIRCMRSQPETG